MSYPEMDPMEREQVEWVFGLTGGELETKPLRLAERLDKEWIRRHWARYWYEGVPDYVSRETWATKGEYLTIVSQLLCATAPDHFWARGRLWRLVKQFANSGETECPGRDDGDGVVVLEEDGEECRFCCETHGEQHGYIYLGDGWAESVYRAGW
jgi:hypothetical protein